jgi:hypothetical protein
MLSQLVLQPLSFAFTTPDTLHPTQLDKTVADSLKNPVSTEKSFTKE